jgi:site-specific recombinase XerC
LELLLNQYQDKLRAGGRTDKHIKYSVNFARAIAEFANFSTAADIKAEAVSRYAGHLLERGRAARTIQSHLSAATPFSHWLVQTGKLSRDPLASVKKPNPNADRRRRRMLFARRVAAARSRDSAWA